VVCAMARVSQDLLYRHLASKPHLAHAYRVVEEDQEIQELLKMANIMAVTRMLYNDHGVTHARIVAGSALEILDILVEHGVKPSTLRDRTARSMEEVQLIVFLPSYLHDIGNSVHRHLHETHSYVLARPILDRILPVLVERDSRIYALRQEILHAIYAHQDDVGTLTIEAGIVKVADGTDMAEGRARVPYRLGKTDMHAVSALSIRSVDVQPGEERPLRITVRLTDMAGLFQVEEVLLRKVRTSSLRDLVEIAVGRVDEEPRLFYPS
jgi:metal-dependent HD superfamily phosphatase/phosphodiesterase